MSVAKEISLITVQKELKKCFEFGKSVGWILSEIDESNQSFTIKMSSPIDNEDYLMEVVFDNYPEIPPLIDFLHPIDGRKNIASTYPKNRDSFFHPNGPCICNPCSRKSYKDFVQTGPHGDWKMIGWQANVKIGTLKTIDAILCTIYSRISNPDFYVGRMGHL